MDNAASTITAEDITKTKSTAWLSYLSFLFLIPMLMNKDSAYSKFHVNQGITLFILGIVLGFVGGILSGVLLVLGGFVGGALSSIVLAVVYIIIAALAIFGIVNAATGKVKRLPVIGGINIYK